MFQDHRGKHWNLAGNREAADSCGLCEAHSSDPNSSRTGTGKVEEERRGAWEEEE